jgi:DNA invertase Pin-like site-specific DNA recombinase
MPVDPEAWEARRERAIRLLALGYSYSTVAKSVGASKTWVLRVAQEQRRATPPD